MNTSELLAKSQQIQDEDCRQTYLLHRLEGMDHDEALSLSTVSRAQPMHSNSNQRGPVDAAGRRTISIAFLAEPERTRSGAWLGTFDHLHPFTMDSRTTEERESDDRRADRVHDAVAQLPETAREIIERIYGLNGHDPQSYQAIADELGRSVGSVAQYAFRARHLLRPLLEAE
jgi:DNA-directed RNA polymerase specialized sigma24 family protein